MSARDETPMKNYVFTITGKIWAGSESHAQHSLFWMIENSEWAADILNKQITIDGEK